MTSDDDDDDDIAPSKPNRSSEQTGMAAEACKNYSYGSRPLLLLLLLLLYSLYMSNLMSYTFLLDPCIIFLLKSHSAWL